MAIIEYKERADGMVKNVCAPKGCVFANPEGGCSRVSCYANIYYSFTEGGNGCDKAAIKAAGSVQVGIMTTNGFSPDSNQSGLAWLEALVSLPSST